MNDKLSIDYTTNNGTRRLSWHIEEVKNKGQVIAEIEKFLSLVFNEEYTIRPKLSISTPKKLILENSIKLAEEELTDDELVNRLRSSHYKKIGYHEAEQFYFPFLKDVENEDAFEYLDSLHPAVL